MRIKTLACCILIVLVSMAIEHSDGQEKDKPKEAPDTCCFERPGYQGICKVQPDEGETVKAF